MDSIEEKGSWCADFHLKIPTDLHERAKALVAGGHAKSVASLYRAGVQYAVELRERQAEQRRLQEEQQAREQQAQRSQQPRRRQRPQLTQTVPVPPEEMPQLATDVPPAVWGWRRWSPQT